VGHLCERWRGFDEELSEGLASEEADASQQEAELVAHLPGPSNVARRHKAAPAALLEGYLHKRGLRVWFGREPDYKRRFFVLRPGRLSYYHAWEDYELGLRAINHQSPILPEQYLVHKFVGFGIKLTPRIRGAGTRVWELRAPNLIEQEAWVAALRAEAGLLPNPNPNPNPDPDPNPLRSERGLPPVSSASAGKVVSDVAPTAVKFSDNHSDDPPMVGQPPAMSESPPLSDRGMGSAMASAHGPGSGALPSPTLFRQPISPHRDTVRTTSTRLSNAGAVKDLI